MYSPIRNYIYFKTGDAAVAEDIAQDTFLKLWEKKKDIREETVKPLLYTIAGNLCKNRYEHQQVVFDFVRKYQPGEHSATPEFELELKEFILQIITWMFIPGFSIWARILPLMKPRW
ncbi:MAG: sigma factor [Draconibacterium sp.]